GPQAILSITEQMSDRTRLPIAAMPNAGLPAMVDGRFLYLSSPGYFAEYAGRLVEAGVRILGGCCGTTPDHIRAMKAVLVSHGQATPEPHHATISVSDRQPPAYDEQQEKAAAAKPTGLAAKLAERAFPISVELDP